ncbi:cation:proton antiporter [Glycomyces tarimensis]
MFNVLLASVGLVAIAVAALSGRLRRLPLSEPLLGLLLGIVLGPAVTGLIALEPLTGHDSLLHEGSRILLGITVMAVALRYPFSTARSRLRPVLLLLVVAMPAMALITAGLSAAMLGLGLGAAALMGAALCPTDPVLASNVVTGNPAEEDLPARSRQLLSLESGANDGLALPLVLVAIAIAGPFSGSSAAVELLWQVAGAIAVGAGMGWLGGRAIRAGEAHGATESGPKLLFTAILALAVLGVSGLLHVDGVLAAFVGGLAFGAVSTGKERRDDVSIDEAVNRFLVLPLFTGFGAMLPWQEWADLGWRVWLFAGSVLVLRRLPVLLLLRRPLSFGWADAVYLGWFGPVGVSALFYLMVEAERWGSDATLIATGALVVAASTVVHGLTSTPGRVAYRWATAEAIPARSVTTGDDAS